ncbi:MAG: Smg protein [Gammaproteobacteria bacterium]|jgi:Smg protein
MKANMLDVLFFMFEHYDDSTIAAVEADPSTSLAIFSETRRLEEQLFNEGFEEQEINLALRWLEDLGTQVGAISTITADSPTVGYLRLFSDEEQRLLGNDCCNFLLSLENDKMISPDQRELIIDRALALDFANVEIDLPQFQWLTLMVLANIPEADDAYDWVEELIHQDAQYMAN